MSFSRRFRAPMLVSALGAATSAYIVVPPMRAWRTALDEAARERGLTPEQAVQDEACLARARQASDNVVDPHLYWTNLGRNLFSSAGSAPAPLERDSRAATALAPASAPVEKRE